MELPMNIHLGLPFTKSIKDTPYRCRLIILESFAKKGETQSFFCHIHPSFKVAATAFDKAKITQFKEKRKFFDDFGRAHRKTTRNAYKASLSTQKKRQEEGV